MSNDNEIRRLMKAGMDQESTTPRVSLALSRARRQVGQRDTLSFALVRIWSVLARLLAPFFAAVAARQASVMHQRVASQNQESQENTNQEQGESK